MIKILMIIYLLASLISNSMRDQYCSLISQQEGIVSNKGDQSAGASYWAGVCAAAVAAVPSVILSSPRQVRLVAVSQ